MSAAGAVEVVSKRLERVGYERVPGRFKVASITFDFPAVLTGSVERGSDLVVIIDAEEAKVDGGNRARQRLEALTLALDVAQWQVVVTAILVGPPLSASAIREMTQSCRVLTATQASIDGVDDAPSLDDRLRVLLPLDLGRGADGLVADPIGHLSEQLRDTPDARLLGQLIDASLRGEDEVRRLLARSMESAVAPGLTSA